MVLIRPASSIFLAFAVLTAGCKQVMPSATMQATKQQVAAQPAALPRETAPANSPQAAPAVQATQAVPAGQPVPVADVKVEDVEEREGPFTLAGKTFTVVLHSKHLPPAQEGESVALASLDIIDAGGVVQHHEEFPYTVENGSFSESCSAEVNTISGSNGAGFLLASGCLPSAPMNGGPWQILGVINGKLKLIGKPLYAQGEMGEFVPGKINKIGNATQILDDGLRFRLFTGYFYVVVPLRVNWMEGKLALAEHCYYATGHGLAEGGCEMPVEGAERAHGEQEMTFVRMFTEPEEQVGTAEHVVIKSDSKIEILAGKIMVTWKETEDGIELGVGDDIWVKLRVNGKVGWIHTNEDLEAIGLYQSG